MKINLKKSEIILMIMDFFKNENLDKSLVSLENETGVHLFEYNREISFLRQLILDGHWSDAEEFIRPLKEHPKFEYNSSIFEIRKQKFLEAVEQEPDAKNSNVEDLVELLKDLQSRCNANIFNQLMFCLSSPSITEHSEYKNWTPLSGRLKCFEKLRAYLELIYPVEKDEVRIQPGSFSKLLKALIVNKITEGENYAKNTKQQISQQITPFSILDDKFARESFEGNNSEKESTVQITIEDDIKPKNKTSKDDNEVFLKKSNTALKAMRNEKISQSLKVNKISEIEDEENKVSEMESEEENMKMKIESSHPGNKKKPQQGNFLYEIPEIRESSSMGNANLAAGKYNNTNSIPMTSAFLNTHCNNILNIDKYNAEILEEESEEEINVNTQNKAAKYQDNNPDNSQNAALSDLDKEEYFMKSCYEYFDYDIGTLSERKVIHDSHPIRTSSFSPKGDFFAIGTNSKSIKIFEMSPVLQKFNKKNSYNFKAKSGEITEMEEIKLAFEQKNHHHGSIYCLDWSISGRLIASGSNDKLVKLMVVPDLEESYGIKDQETLELTISGHKGTVRSVSFEPTSDLVLLSAGTIDTCIKVWDAEKGTNITNLEGHTSDIFTIKWSNDSLICASSGADKTIRFWDLRDYKSTSLISALKYPDINDISIFTKNKTIASTYIAAGHVDGTITIWDYNKKSIIKEICEHSDEVRSVSFSPDGKYLASASFDSKIKLFDVGNKFELIGELEHFDRAVSVKWHPEVPLLISTSADKTARIWMPDT